MKRKILLIFLAGMLMFTGCLLYPAGTYPYGYPNRVYYANPPLNPEYGWVYWYTQPAYPGFVFFFGNDGKHHRHQHPHHR